MLTSSAALAVVEEQGIVRLLHHLWYQNTVYSGQMLVHPHR
jgi:hypothetical protein